MTKFLTRISLLAALVVAGGSSAAADPIDATKVSSFEFGKAYSVGMFKSFSGTVELPAGKVNVYNMPEGTFATDSEGGGKLTGSYAGYGTLICDDGTKCYGQIYSYEITEAGTYYFSNFGESIWDDKNFGIQLEGGQAIAYTEVSPAEGSTMNSTVSAGGTGYLTISFNVPVTYDSAYLKCGDVTSASVTPVDTGFVTNMNVMLRELIKEFQSNGTFSADGGEAFQVVIEGIRDSSGNQYGENGTLTLNYVAGPKLMNILTATMNNANLAGQDFMTYWPVVGTSNAVPGMLIFTFDQQLTTSYEAEEDSPYLEIGAGNIETENGYYYEQVLPTKIMNRGTQGGMYFDLRGVNRKSGFESKDLKDGTIVTVKLCNVRDMNGNLPEPAVDASGNVTNVGSYCFNMVLKYVPEQVISYEFTPDNGDVLSSTDNLELWYNNSDVILSFDGILFSYEDGTSELVAASELTNESEEEGEVVYNIPVPTRAKTEPVEVSMSNIVSIDGYEKNISASYNKFVITYSTPFTEGGRYTEVPADPWLIGDDTMTDNDKLIHASTNYATSYPGLFMKYSIDDVTNPENVKNLHSSDMKRLEDGEYVGCAMNHAQALYAGHTYTLTFTAWATENDCNYGYPALGSYAITFYGDGELFQYSDINFVSITPDPNDGPIYRTQTEFVITYDGIVKLNEATTGVPGGLGTGLKPVTCEAVNADPENDGFASEWKITVPESYLTGSGLDLSVGAYDINGLTVEGDMHSESATDYKSFAYEIYDPSAYVALNSDPADGSTVTEISVITLSTDVALGHNWGYTGTGIQIYNKTQEVVRTLVRSEYEDENEVVVTSPQALDEDGNPAFDGLGNPIYTELTTVELRLKEPITEEGGYMVVIPEAYFITGDQYDTNFTQATNITLTVGAEASTGLRLSVEPEDGSVVESIAIIHVTTSANIYNDCPDYYMTLKRDQWTDVAEWSYSQVTSGDWHIEKLYETPYDNSTPLVGYNFYIGSLQETAGEYTLTIPAKFFEKDGQFNDKMVVTFSIASAGEEITITTSPADGAEIIKGEFNEFYIYTNGQVDPSTDVAITMENYADYDAFQEFSPSNLEVVEGGYKLTITENALKNTLGQINVSIPNGFFVLGSSKNADTFITLNIVEAGGSGPVVSGMNLVITPDPNEEATTGVVSETLDEIIIYNAGGLTPTQTTSDWVRVDNETTGANVKNLGPIWFTSNMPVSGGGCYVDANTAKIVFSPAGDRKANAYKLTIPAGYFKDNAGNTNELVELHYVKSDGAATGIISVLGESANGYEVYRVNGLKVMSTQDAHELNTLAPGMYIINGKKFIIR